MGSGRPADDGHGDEHVELDEERRRYVRELFARLDAMSHYELLGVERNADRKAIRAAFFRLASLLHPDRYFGKRLGGYLPKLEAIFERVIRASDTLSSPALRAEYDADLGLIVEAKPGSDPAPASAPTSPSDAAGDIQRRRQLARDALQQRFGDPQSRAVERARAAKQHVDGAATARAAGDLQTAAELLRLATTLLPNDEVLRTEAEAARRAANERLAESLERQAMLEEKYGHWRQAAASWQRILEANPDHPQAAAQLAIAIERAQRAK